jgi:sec-independent protein translocase protein TatA
VPGITELLVILVIVMVVFGASRLPLIGRGLGEGIKNFKDAVRKPVEIDVTPEKETEESNRPSST